MSKTGEKKWVLYILLCGDNSLYTGITNDIEKRMGAHQAGKGAKYTRGRGPLTILYIENCGSRSDASKREVAVKAMSRTEKLSLCD